MKIGKYQIGDGHPCFIVAEIGINHNGDIDVAKELIDMASSAGCNAVKFQKRTPDICVPEHQKSVMRDTPWGRMSYLDYRHRVEFGLTEYSVIDAYCREKRILWFASCWDISALNFMHSIFNPPCYKVASASLTDSGFLYAHKSLGKPVILSTGMSTWEEINHAVEVFGSDNLVLLHCNSSYPAKTEELNLEMIYTMRLDFGIPVGYSGHETGVFTTLCAVVMGACVVERHVTIDRSMWGSDQSASLERGGLNKLVEEIRTFELARGDGLKRIYESEKIIRDKLRK